MVAETMRPTARPAEPLIAEQSATLLRVLDQQSDDIGVQVDNVLRLARVAAHVVESRLGHDCPSVTSAGLVAQVELPISNANCLKLFKPIVVEDLVRAHRAVVG